MQIVDRLLRNPGDWDNEAIREAYGHHDDPVKTVRKFDGESLVVTY